MLLRDKIAGDSSESAFGSCPDFCAKDRSQLPRSVKRGDLVSYAGRAFRVRRLRTVLVEGTCLEVLEIAHTGQPRGIVFIPLHRVGTTITRISKNEAAALDAAVPIVLTFAQSRLQKARAAQIAKAADWCRMGGIAKAARKRAA